MNNRSKGIPENQQALCAGCSEYWSLRSIKIIRVHPRSQGRTLLHMDWGQPVYSTPGRMTECILGGQSPLKFFPFFFSFQVSAKMCIST